MKADNTSAIVVLIDQLGPRKLSILKKKREEKMKEVAQRRSLDNQAVAELLAAKESLTKSPKKENTKNIVPPPILQPPNTEISDTCKAHMALKEGVKMAKPCDKAVSAVLKGSDSLDDSVQIRNSHLVLPVSGSGKKHDTKHDTKYAKSTPPSPRARTSPLQTSSSENLCRTGMATRSSPLKSSEALKSSVNALTAGVSGKRNIHLTRASNHGTNVDDGQQKYLQPIKNTSENVRNASANKLHSDIKVRDLENIFSTGVKLSLKNIKNSQKSKVAKNTSNSNAAIESPRFSKKVHSAKSLSTRISLRLRRLRQKTQQNKVKGQSENKGYITKSGTKRKIDSTHSCGTPATKKIRHS